MDEYSVKITSQAKEQITLIRNHIAFELKEPERAKRVIHSLREEGKKLSYMPTRIKCIEEQPWGGMGYRRIIVENYYLYFWIDEELKIVYVIAIDIQE